MPITLTETSLNASVNSVAGTFDGGSVQFKAGATVLAELTLAADVFPAAASGSTTATTTSDPTLGVPVVATGAVTATGTCDGFTILNNSDQAILSGTVSVVGGGGSFELSQTEFSSGDLLVISTVIYSQPATGA
jgi:hypothetical protein